MLEAKPLLFSARADKLRKMVETLCAMDRHAPDQSHEVIPFLEKKLNKHGITVEKEPFHYEGQDYFNVIGTKPGIGPHKDEVLYLVAHFDTVYKTPGADDNTSSVAALLEVVHLLKDLKFDRTIKFLLCNLEERQYLEDQPLEEKPKGEVFVGSTFHVKNLSERAKENIKGAIVLEMIGYTGQELEKAQQLRSWYTRWALWAYASFLGAEKIGKQIFDALADPKIKHDFVTILGNGVAADFVKRSMGILDCHDFAFNTLPILVPGKGEYVPNSRRSDHVAFWEHAAKIPAFMISDTADLRNPHYHKESDTPDQLNYQYLKDNTEKVATIIANMVGFKDVHEEMIYNPSTKCKPK